MQTPALVRALAFSVVVAAIVGTVEFHQLEARLYDLRMRVTAVEDPVLPITLVTIDPQTAQTQTDSLPLSLAFHTELLKRLEASQPRAIGYLVNMGAVHQVRPEQFRERTADEFLATASRLESHGTPFVIGTSFDISGELLPPFPLSRLSHAIAITHQDGTIFGMDRVSRRALLKLNDRPSFALSLAEKLGLRAAGDKVKGAFRVEPSGAEYFFFRYRDLSQTDSKKGSIYPTIPAERLLAADWDPSALKDRIVLVGTTIPQNPGDFSRSVFSKDEFAVSKLALHGMILESVAANNGIVENPGVFPIFFAWLTVVLVYWFVLSFTPVGGVMLTLGLLTSVVLLGILMFRGFGSGSGIWIHLDEPLIGIFLSYYLAVPYRLIREYKKRWDYQRRNEILTQVEELKGNFLSLVTHDLKTPVARIQGLAEVIKRKSGDRLLPLDLQSLDKIMESTEELNRFISSILELSKLESGRITLQLESKDINGLIEKTVESFRAQARMRGIKITTDLEPLFPIKLDASLIQKVVNNLIDNALKYSPAGSTVRVETRDAGNSIEVAVTDEGVGLSPSDQEQLFSKFHRVKKSDLTAETSGSGLGLYLSKFFIEAHRGHIHVESQEGIGSRFKIVLPSDLTASASASGLKVSSLSQPSRSSRESPESKESSHV